MNIFVNENETVDVSVHYFENGNEIVVFDEPTEKTTELKVSFRRPDFAISQRLMASSTVADQNGGQTVNLVLLQNNMLYFLAKSWNATDKEGKPVELNSGSISNLRVEIARALVNKLVPAIGQII